jgi:hypothetical protein
MTLALDETPRSKHRENSKHYRFRKPPRILEQRSRDLGVYDLCQRHQDGAAVLGITVNAIAAVFRATESLRIRYLAGWLEKRIIVRCRVSPEKLQQDAVNLEPSLRGSRAERRERSFYGLIILLWRGASQRRHIHAPRT